MSLIPRWAGRRWRGWWIAGTVTAVLLSAAVMLIALAFPSVAATTCPGCYGLERLQPGVYAEPRLAPAERRRVAEVVEQANRRVRDLELHARLDGADVPQWFNEGLAVLVSDDIYAEAACQVSRWAEANGGEEAVPALIERLSKGQAFPDLRTPAATTAPSPSS
ncbi:hypothetical protein ACQEUU_25830 [Nonomuraea sp. CA-218870]|uniref:hypothetical protein n=1 Tax=Nonomuraea sp. CA-218870 TaxID=3239998 RepID=UPI003D8A4970